MSILGRGKTQEQCREDREDAIAKRVTLLLLAFVLHGPISWIASRCHAWKRLHVVLQGEGASAKALLVLWAIACSAD